MKISEIDSHCFKIEFEDFRTMPDATVYFDQGRSFYAQDNRTWKRTYFPHESINIGDVAKILWDNEYK